MTMQPALDVSPLCAGRGKVTPRSPTVFQSCGRSNACHRLWPYEGQPRWGNAQNAADLDSPYVEHQGMGFFAVILELLVTMQWEWSGALVAR